MSPDAEAKKKNRHRAGNKKLFFAGIGPGAALATALLLFHWGAFSFLATPFYFLALFVLFIWFIAALKPRAVAIHGLCLVTFVGFLAAGSCWGQEENPDLRLWVNPPVTTKAAAFLLRAPLRQVVTLPVGTRLEVSYTGQAPVKIAFAGDETVLQGSPEAPATAQFTVPATASRRLVFLAHTGWRRLGFWTIESKEDTPPKITWRGEPVVTVRKSIRLSYELEDDNGITSVVARVTDSAGAAPAEQKRKRFPLEAISFENGAGGATIDLGFSPWAGHSVFIVLEATDSAGQQAFTEPRLVNVPPRIFRHPLARALMEEREKILADPSPTACGNAANIMAGIARRYDVVRRDTPSVLALRTGAVRLVLNRDARTVEKTADVLWHVALRLEEGAPGRARAELSSLAHDLLHALQEKGAPASLEALAKAAEGYFSACESEKECGFMPFLAEAQGVSPRENFKERLDVLAQTVAQGNEEKIVESVRVLRDEIEKLPTVRPDMNPAQNKLAGQIAALRDFVRSQKTLAETALLFAQGKDKKAFERLAEEQNELALTLRDLAAFSAITMPEIADSRSAMEEAARLLRKGAFKEAGAQQAAALALLENALLALSEKMRQTYAGRVSDDF